MTVLEPIDAAEAAADIVPVNTAFLSDIPARLDRLRWSAWHTRIVMALGITWMLDGLEVTLVGAVAPLVAGPSALNLSDAQIGIAATCYLAGAVIGALVFGRLSDQFGRRRLFFVTLAVYASATALTAVSWNFVSFALFRALTGAGIGGEGAAVNSAIDELLPARVRGHASLAISGSYWLGTALGATLALVVADPRLLPAAWSWRVAFFVGAALAGFILLLRRNLPESPRWLLLHGRLADAERAMSDIERRAPAIDDEPPVTTPLVARGSVGIRFIARELLQRHPRRTALGLSLMIAQAFAYNGVFFTYALVLVRFYGVSPAKVGAYLIPFAIGNFLGPLTLGRLFDTVGRRPMIVATYAGAGALIALAGWGMVAGWLTAATQTLLWSLAFFVASAAASAGYLTVSELFPVELRSMAIAVFYSVGTAAGGLLAPAVFGALVQTGERARLLDAYLVSAGLMVAGAMAALFLGVAAERKSLEDLSRLSR